MLEKRVESHARPSVIPAKAGIQRLEENSMKPIFSVVATIVLAISLVAVPTTTSAFGGAIAKNVFSAVWKKIFGADAVVVGKNAGRNVDDAIHATGATVDNTAKNSTSRPATVREHSIEEFNEAERRMAVGRANNAYHNRNSDPSCKDAIARLNDNEIIGSAIQRDLDVDAAVDICINDAECQTIAQNAVRVCAEDSTG